MSRNGKSLLLYQKPTVLDRTVHRGLRLKSLPPDFGFARETNSIPVTGAEFATAAASYPIVFAGKSTDDLVACALVGLRADENLFVQDDGAWPVGYVPAFVRRYPFALAEKPNGGFHVCVDAAHAGIGEDEGEPLFDEDGKERPVLKHAVAFLRDFQGQFQRTREFVSRVAALKLFEPKVVKVVTGNGETSHVLRDFHVIDEKRLLAIDDHDLRTLFANGELGWIYAHLISLLRLSALQERLDRHLTDAAAGVSRDDGGNTYHGVRDKGDTVI